MNRNEFLQLIESINGFHFNHRFEVITYITDDRDFVNLDPIRQVISDRLINIIPDINLEDIKQIFNIQNVLNHDSDESSFYLLNCNLNELFDLYVKNQELKSKNITIYRLSNVLDKGVFDTNVAFELLKTDFGSPFKDESFKFIFPENIKINQYTRKWYFACSSKKQLKLWIDKKENIQKLIDSGILLSKITIPEHFVIHGKEQVIYKKDEILSVKHESLNTLNDLFNKKSKLIR